MVSFKVAVIGASGLLGQARTRVLESHRYEVSGTYVSRPAERLTRLDITDADQVRDYFRRVQPQAVFLTAALTHNGGQTFRQLWHNTSSIRKESGGSRSSTLCKHC